MGVGTGGRYEFGRFSLDASERLLERGGEAVPLPPKVFDTLIILVEHSGHVLGKEELLSAVWGDTFVEEGSLTRNISLLRKALQEEGGEKYIETVPKRGYRFVAPVRTAEAAALSTRVTTGRNGNGHGRVEIELAITDDKGPTATVAARAGSRKNLQRLFAGLLIVAALAAAGGYLWMTGIRKEEGSRPTIRQPVRSLAVLPFKVLGSDGESEPMGLGMADAIILRLGRSENCRIRPTGAVSKYAAADFDTLKAGKELGVDAVLEGTVQRVGERVRVTAMLWSLKDARPMWSGKFDESFGDIFALQDSVSAQVADQLRLRIDSESPAGRRYFPANVEAYRYYTMGYFFWTKRTKPTLAKAIQYFRMATETDPNYALAYASLADAYLLDAYFGYDNLPLQEAYDNAKDAAAKAVRIDDTLPEAQVAAGMVSEFEGDLKRAENSYGRAIELDPSSTTARLRYSHLLASTSRLDRAISELRTASEIEPASPTIHVALGGYLLLARQYDESIKSSKLALELNPEIYAARENIAWAYAEKAMYGEASAEFNTLTQTTTACEFGGAGMAYVAARKGRAREALELLAQAKKRLGNGNGLLNPSLQIAMVLSQLGEKEEAFVWLERAVLDGRLQPYQLEYNAGLDSIRSDPRFGRMMERARNARPPVKGLG